MNQQPKRIEVKPEELESFLKRVETRQLRDEDYALIRGLVESFNALRRAVQEKGASVKRLLRMMFGASTESSKNLQKKSDDDDDKPAAPGTGSDSQSPPSKPAAGHGRNGSAAYTGAHRHQVSHPDLAKGTRCPRCGNGNLYVLPQPSAIVHFIARPPIHADIYELEQFRCSSCGMVFPAPLPPEAGTDKYDASAGSMIAILKYGSGLPFHRLAQLQKSLGVPLPASTQWEVVAGVARDLEPVYRELLRLAAQGEIIHVDDTTMKVLALMKERSSEKNGRTGMFTTGILSIGNGHQIALFFTGANHAGENMRKLLTARAQTLDPPIQMCDALSRNYTHEFEVILSNCLTHARRNFVEIIDDFPVACRHVIETLAMVYSHDETTKQRGLTALERLAFHQQQSAPLMAGLKDWLERQFVEKMAEPNSSLGKAIAYLLNHWEPLTLFLRVPGAPLDNNLCEQILKRAILHRKNALFFKTRRGAYIGDLFMSLIHTCKLEKVNPFPYLNALQNHAAAVLANPGNWLPWNYQAAIPPP